MSVGNLASNRDKGNDARVLEELEGVMIAHYDEKTNKVYFKQELIEDLI